nr:MAG TPA: hypothetical protein [Caudoviricetes sp.]
MSIKNIAKILNKKSFLKKKHARHPSPPLRLLLFQQVTFSRLHHTRPQGRFFGLPVFCLFAGCRRIVSPWLPLGWTTSLSSLDSGRPRSPAGPPSKQ